MTGIIIKLGPVTKKDEEKCCQYCSGDHPPFDLSKIKTFGLHSIK